MPAKHYECTLIEKTRLCTQTISLRFEPKKAFGYQPGQFVSLVVPSGEEKIVTKRLFSLASAPQVAKELGYELCIKLHDGGVATEYVKQLTPGDSFDIYAPYGDFMLEKTKGSLCFIANGTGVCPVRSMLQSQEFEKSRPDNVTCIFGFRKEADILYSGEWEQFDTNLEIVLSQPSKKWQGFRGRVPEFLPHSSIRLSDLTDTQFYVVGTPEMVIQVAQLLLSWGVPPTSIHKELFGGK